MRLVLFGDDFRLGVLKGDQVIDASSVANEIPHMTPQQMMSGLIGNFDQHRGKLEQLVSSGQGTPMSQVRLRAPLPRPSRMVCMAGNYMENGTRAEAGELRAFNKSSSSVVGNGDTIVIPSAPATVYQHEAELGIVVGKTSKGVKADQAYNHIFGYMNFIDVSCRGMGAGGDTFFIGKSWDTFGPMGPVLVTSDEIADPQNLQIRLWVQGDLRQDYNTSDMAHGIPATFEWITWITTLEPGDVIACGTNHRGLGPLQDGDLMEMEIENFGKLTNPVRDDLKRSWPRETRAQVEAREAAAARA
jgi:2-keto-4-pentenoate hydratase/2-oxohepta-3-ene-1,7-dioic acid hydratase in catechol pathway